MAKKEAVLMEDVEAIVTATTGTAVATSGGCSVDLTGINQGDCGGTPWAKVSRKEGTVTVEGMELLKPGSSIAMFVVGNQAKTFVSYDSVKTEKDGKTIYLPRAKYENKEGKFATAEAEAIAAGETVPNADGSWPNGIAPTAVPAINLQVMLEDETGSVALGERYFSPAMLPLGKKDYYGVASKYFTSIAHMGSRPGFQPFYVEYALSVCPKDKYDNFYIQALLTKVHQPDSDFAKAALETLG